MTDPDPQPRRRRRTPESPPPAQGSVAKGAILVAVAVIIGFVLIRDDGIESQTSAVGADVGVDVDEGNDDAATDDTTTDDTTPSSVPDARDPAEVRVLVANGTAVSGAAGRYTEVLTAAGYQTAGATDALDKSAETTFVYFTAGYEAEARAVAAALGASPDNVAALPTAPVVADNSLANVIVVVGPELANA